MPAAEVVCCSAVSFSAPGSNEELWSADVPVPVTGLCWAEQS